MAIRELAERVPVVAFVNNDFAGYAPQTVAQLRAALDAAGEADARDTAAGSGRPRRALPGRENSRADQQIRTSPNWHRRAPRSGAWALLCPLTAPTVLSHLAAGSSVSARWAWDLAGWCRPVN